MRYLSYFSDGAWRLGALVGDAICDVSRACELAGCGPAIPSTMRGFIAAGRDAWRCAAEVIGGSPSPQACLPLAAVRVGPPVPDPGKIMAIGQNYLDHVREQGVAMPDRPILFAKFPTSLVGQGEAISWDPALSDKIDWEVELAVVIGREARRISPEEAYHCVFGYTVANDVTARDLQHGDGQWVRGKSLDTFCPMGPWIVTSDELPDPHGLALRCLVNGEIVQSSSTAQMIFSVPALVSFLSQAFTLLPGDLLLTGTPPGVGHHRKPPRYLRDGDTVTVEIDGIGSMSNPCRTLGTS